MGYKKISTKINAVKKKLPCPYCKGKGILKDESIFEGVDVTETPCTACQMSGISLEGNAELIENITVNTWLFGHIGDINPKADNGIIDLPLYKKIKDLNKKQIQNICTFLGE